MRRPFWWPALCVLALVVAPLAMSFAAPVTVALAEPSAPAGLRHDQVVVLTSSYQIQAFDLAPQPGMVSANWNSGTDVGWQNIAAGDFNGDGDQEIAAISGSRIKVFDPFVQPGSTAVQFQRTLDGGRYFRLITTGDFDGDGKDEIATTATEYLSGNTESLRIYDGGTDGNTWSETHLAYYNAQWQAMAAGDFLHSGADDLALVRNPSGWNPYTLVLNGRGWWMIAEREDAFPWFTLAAGKLDSPSSPDQLVLLRTGVGADFDSVIMFNVYVGGIDDVFPGQSGNFRYSPHFTSLALGTQVAGYPRQIFILRDPTYWNTGLLMLNPSGAPIGSFEVALDYGSAAWRQVRTGDVDGDGLSEVAILRGDRFRVYRQPGGNYDTYPDVLGSFLVQPDGTDWPVMLVANLDGPGISAGPALSVTPASLSYDLDYGADSPVKTLVISNSGTSSSFAWQAQVTSGNEWLQLNTASGFTSGQVNVTVRTNITPGTYGGTIRISAVDSGVKNSPVDIPVTLKLANPGFVATPLKLSIWQKIGGPTVTKQVQILRPGLATDWVATALPLSAAANVEQMIASGRITVRDGSAALDGQAVAPPAWLVFAPDSGTTPSTMTVSVQTTTPGKYRGMIIIAAKDATLADPVRWVEVDAVAANQFYFSFLPLIVKP